MNRGTFADYIKDSIKEPIEAIVIGNYGWDGYEEPEPKISEDKRGIILKPEEALNLLSQQYHGGFGAPDCYAVYIWTPTKVYWITQYDGATGLDSAPRNPENILPDMPGG
jgi:hypothetical protein